MECLLGRALRSPVGETSSVQLPLFFAALIWKEFIYDVLIEIGQGRDPIGISCKMRDKLREVRRKNHVTIEFSNASGKFWDSIKEKGYTQKSYDKYSGPNWFYSDRYS